MSEVVADSTLHACAICARTVAVRDFGASHKPHVSQLATCSDECSAALFRHSGSMENRRKAAGICDGGRS